MRIAHNTTFVFTAFTVPYLILLLFADQAKSDIDYYSTRGVIALKKTPYDFSSHATLHFYTRVTIENGLPTKIMKGGQSYKIERPDLAEYIEFPKKPTAMLTEIEKADFRASYSELRIFLNKYRQLRPMRQSYFDGLDEVAKNIDRGLVLYRGKWITQKHIKITLKNFATEL